MRTVLARKIALNGFVLLVASLLIGTTSWRFSEYPCPWFRSAAGWW
jgi:hypothetical protein